MKKANLLINAPHLAALKQEMDANESLKNMFEAYNEATEQGDKIYIPSDFWDFNGYWGDSFVLTILGGFELAKSKLEWLDYDSYTLLASLIEQEMTPTPNHIAHWQEFEQEFPLENNGLLGCQVMQAPPFVWDKWSWHELHCAYHTNYPQYIAWLNNNVLPNTDYSNFCIVNCVDKNAPMMANRSQADKINYFNTNAVRVFRNNKGELLLLATEIARRNCYLKDEKLTKSEKVRRAVRMAAIFKIKKAGRYQYLSLDTENGQFEVCDHKGGHIGVWNFTGIQTKFADTDGNHDIKV